MVKASVRWIVSGLWAKRAHRHVFLSTSRFMRQTALVLWRTGRKKAVLSVQKKGIAHAVLQAAAVCAVCAARLRAKRRVCSACVRLFVRARGRRQTLRKKNSMVILRRDKKNGKPLLQKAAPALLAAAARCCVCTCVLKSAPKVQFCQLSKRHRACVRMELVWVWKKAAGGVGAGRAASRAARRSLRACKTWCVQCVRSFHARV